MTRPYDDLLQLRLREERDFPLAAAFCRALDRGDTLSALPVDRIDRERATKRIPSIFGPMSHGGCTCSACSS